MTRLQGKSALITGSARGIGRAFAEAYIARGSDGRDCRYQSRARAERPPPRSARSAYAVEMDVTSQASIDAAIAAVVAKAGGLDILVNNAALFDLAPIVEITRESYDRLFSINVAGTLFTMQAAARQMIAQGTRRQDHQYGKPGGAPRRGARRRLLRHQGGGDQPDPVGGAEPDQAWHQRQRDRARRRRWRTLGRRRCAVRQIREPAARRKEKAGRRRSAFRAHGHGRRPDGHGDLPRLVPKATMSSRRPTMSMAATG